MKNEMTLDQKQLAWMLDVTPTSIRNWATLPVNPLPTISKTPWTFDPHACVQWLLARRIEALSQTDSPIAARARLDSLRADEVEHKLLTARRGVLPAEVLRHALDDAARQAKEILVKVPARVAKLIPALRRRELKILEAQISKAGAAIASARLDAD